MALGVLATATELMVTHFKPRGGADLRVGGNPKFHLGLLIVLNNACDIPHRRH